MSSELWRQRSRRRLRAAYDACEWCAERASLQAHHLHYDTLSQETPRDLLVLCDTHHRAAHAGELDSEELQEIASAHPHSWDELDEGELAREAHSLLAEYTSVGSPIVSRGGVWRARDGRWRCLTCTPPRPGEIVDVDEVA